MTMRPSHHSMTSTRSLQRKRRLRLSRESAHRRMQLETLEDRRLLAGLQLAGIASNQGNLINPGDIYTVAPNDLVFRFNDDARLDVESLQDGIEIIRSGSDGTFESASVRTDLNTNGQVIVEFTAVQAGDSGNGIRLEFTRNNRGATGGVGINVSGSLVQIDLNTNTSNRTTAAALRNAVNSHPLASQLIQASIFQGNSFTDVAAPAINYSPLVMNNANKAKGSSDFNLGNTMEIEFTAVADGIAGNGLRVTFSRADQGAAGAPRITVNGRTLNIELNTHAGAQTTAAALVTAVNTNPVANQLIRARQVAGQPNRVLTNSANILPVTLVGANDVVITGGFVGLGDFPNEAIFRFAEPLVDDVYRINVIGRPGEGRNPVRDDEGNLFLNGEGDYNVTFELDLAPQILSVVPQPVERLPNGTLQQRRNQIHVYFNNDDLNRESAENPNFYQLIKTQDTARNTDDVWFYPTNVQYDPALDRAILTFATDLDQLDASDPGAATFRLRIGTAETLPLAPVNYTPSTDPGTSFSTAYDLSSGFETGTILSMLGGGGAFRDGQTFTILSQAGISRTFEFNDTFGGTPGVAPGNVAINFSTNLSINLMAQAIANAINNAGFGVQATTSVNNASTPPRTIINLTNDAVVTLGMNVSGMAKTSQALVISGTISNEGSPYQLQFPGDPGEPGHRNIPVESHLIQGPDNEIGITTAYYNFQSQYGFDPQGNVLQNAITAVQRQRVREIFELYGHYFGIQFIESATQGMTIAVGDLRAVNPGVASAPGGVLSISAGGVDNGVAVMDLQDFSTQNDEYGGDFFYTAMRAVGRLLGLGANFELPPLTVMGQDLGLAGGVTPEPIFPGDHDITHGQHLYRPESKDIDLYRFEVPQRGLFSAETFAERLTNSSSLDTVLNLYRETPDGFELVARNDDYYSNDSYIELELEPGTYFIGVSASGNNEYDPTIEDSGIGGTTEGQYQLRLTFRGESTRGIVDSDTGGSSGRSPTMLDGNNDGTPGGSFNFWFNAQTPARTVFVDKLANASVADGSAQRPYKNINAALQRATQLRQQTGEQIVVRIVGNGGADGDITTQDDNAAYEIGFSALNGSVLADGPSLEVPRGVTVMIDSGVIIKARRAYVGVGSLTSQTDRSAGALQVLGVPRVIGADGQVVRDEFGQAIPGNVVFTSLHERIGVGSNPQTNPPAPIQGDWGGVIFASDIDNLERTRFNWEREGIFLNSIYYADMRYGGGNVQIGGSPTVIEPVHIIDSRPAIANNTITRSNRAAISATPNSFAETNFHAPQYQASGQFTSDYSRVGPDISGNRIVDNTLNGLFVRTRTRPGESTERMTVAGRFDDTDIVHILQENLIIAGNPGGPRLELVAPPTTLVTVSPGSASGTLAPGSYNYILTFVDSNGNESPSSNVTRDVTVAPGVGSVNLANLPTVAQFPEYVARRIYRSAADGSGPYTLVQQIDGFATTYVDNGTTAGGTLTPVSAQAIARLNGRLRIDPGTVLKSEGAIIDVEMGANLIAEGLDGNRVIMTSLGDIRYGAGGTFATTNNPNEVANSGDWGGIFAGPLSQVNLDHVVVAYAGGSARVDGDFRNFNALEIHQARARVANSVFEHSADGFNPAGTTGNGTDDRFGRGFNNPGVIYVRGAQPVIVGNTFLSNDAAVININANSLNHYLVNDLGRATGESDVYREVFGNRGPLISGNRLDNNDINGMVVRSGVLTTEGVWDDTDIVHVVQGTISVPNFHTFGGLRLVSSPTQSLVVKLDGPNAGFTATGTPLDITDRIGGSLQITGVPGFPVVLTSLNDGTVGAGLRPDGSPQTDTANVLGGLAQIPENASELLDQGQPGDWRSVLITPYSHDRNVEVIYERESPITLVANSNDTIESSEWLGELAPREKAGDDNSRLGFTIYGNISEPADVDVYRFVGRGGSEVWFDIDRTTHSLDTVIELLDRDGVVLARSTNSFLEGQDPSLLHRDASMPSNSVNPLQKSAFEGLDRWSTNPRDAGMRVILPGAIGSRGTFYVRVRSNSPDLNDLQAGQTDGSYQLQLRLRETDEFAGTTVRYADIRYATNGIHVLGGPLHSPLTGEAAESTSPNNTLGQAQPLGNFMATDRGALAVAGTLSATNDVDFFQFEVAYENIDPFPNDPNLLVSRRYVATILDMDYADGLGRANTILSVFDANGNLVLMANASNVSDDQPGPLAGSNMDDMSRGSAGPLDPYLGSVMLPEGIYYAAVSSVAQIPAEFGQFSQAAPVNPLVRLEPVNSSQRIAEHRFGGPTNSTANPATVPVLFNNNSIVPWTLSDVTLYVSQDPGTQNQTNLITVNPMSGQRTTQVGRFNEHVGDIALRWNGDLVSYSSGLETFPFSDANAGRYFQIDTGTAALTPLGASGIETYEMDLGNPPASIRSNPIGDTRIGHGIHFEAITFAVTRNNVEGGFAVGHRPPNIPNPLGSVITRNLLYEFIPATGAAISTPAPNRTGDALSFNAGTQIVERGRLVTDADPFGTDRRVILAPEATTVNAAGISTSVIQHGTQFEVFDGTDSFQFEFVSGPEVNFNLNPSPINPLTIRDGDTFFLNGQAYEFDTGEVFVVTAASGAGIQDGDRFTVTDNQANGVTRIFEWDDGTGGTIPANVIPVPFDISMNQQQLVSQVVSAINSQTSFDNEGNPIFAASAQAIGNRVSLLNSSTASENSAGMVIEGNTGRSQSRVPQNPIGTVLIPIEEVSTNADLVAAFQNVFGRTTTEGVPGVAVGAEGTRANWIGPSTGNFAELVARGVFVDQGNDDQPSAPSIIAIPFLADDAAPQIAQRMADAINGVSGLSATSNQTVVTIAPGLTFTEAGTDDPPLVVAGSAPGGDITGLATLPNNSMWGISDEGGLYQIINFTSAGGAQAIYVQNSRGDLQGINFQGLTEGPRNAEGGRYANMLFGIDVNGRLYAFNTQGVLQPVFANGATSIDTGLTNVNGLAFSNLDFNLWHTTNNRAGDPGHGRNLAFDASRIDVPGNTSMWFGWESQTANSPQLSGAGAQPRYNPVNNSADYNFPGGAHGSLISNPFSLVGYAPEDLPTVYFNYYLETENASALLLPDQFMRDSFRVYAASEDGEWHLLATNNSAREVGLDEYTVGNTMNFQIQELYDVGDNGAPNSWRQARIDLAPLAGRDNIRLRFDFSTAGEMQVGQDNGTGSFIHAIAGNELRDGQQMLIGGDVFEFNLGVTLVAPTGASLQNGQTFTVNGQTFEFDSNGTVGAGNIAVPFQSGQSANSVATEILRVLQVNPIAGVTPRLHDNRLQLQGATTVTTSFGSPVRLDGNVGVSGGNIPITIHADMTPVQVAQAVQLSLANQYSGGVLEAFKIHQNRVQIVGQTVASAGPLGLTDSLQADSFGSWTASTLANGTTNAFNPGALRAQNNNFEGVYIDDIIIGFAERGEMVTGASGNSSYVANPALPTFQGIPVTQNLVGEYQLEIRRGQDYGMGVPGFPQLLLQQTFDTNERMAQAFTLVAPKASEIVDGQTFRIGDGTNFVVFEYEDTTIGNGVAPGHIAIPFNPVAPGSAGGFTGDSEIVMARRIRDAINSAPAQAVLDVRAGLSDGRVTGTASTDHRINLYGNVILGNLLPEVIELDATLPEPNDTLATAVASQVAPGVTTSFRADGVIGNNPNFLGGNAGLDVDLYEFHFTAGTRLQIGVDAARSGSPLNSRLRLFNFSGTQLATNSIGFPPGQAPSNDPYIEFQIPETGTYYIGVSSSNNTGYNPRQAGSGSAGSTLGFYQLQVDIDASGIEYIQYDMTGDQNRFRDQGQLLVHSNFISNSADFAINIDAGPRDGQNPLPGAPRVTREVNSQRLVPGVVVENNVVFANATGGIRYSGDTNPAGQALGSVPFGRILNNTLVGVEGSGTGILVQNNASPTVLNNIVTQFNQGVSVDGSSSSTVLGGMLYQSNATNSNVGLGTSAIVLAADTPLFRDPESNNFYLVPGSQAIDSSISSMTDRPAMTSVRTPLGIAPSPVVAPSRDVFGQIRTDDPSVEPPPGAGENPFIDRGAIDRSDFAGPIAFLIDPRDNDPQGVDRDPRTHYVSISNTPMQGFAIQLRDGIEPIDPANGVGVDDQTVTKEQVTVLRNGVLLVEGVDYRFRYDSTNKVINLSPMAGIWPGNSVYVIQLANRDQFIVSAPAGDAVNDGESFQLVDQEGNAVTFEYESGYTLFVPETLSLRVPSAGGGLGGMTDGQTFTVNDGTRTVTFEFDNNGQVATGNIPIVFTPGTTAEAMAETMVQALASANIGLQPRDLGQGVVHVGTIPQHVVNTGNAPGLTRSGSEQGGVADGETFTLDDGTRVTTFEFNRVGSVQTGNIAIPFQARDTYEDLGVIIATAIANRSPVLDPVHLGNGVVNVGGTSLTVLDTEGSRLTQEGLPGVQSGFGILIPSIGGVPQGIVDGTTFQIGNGIDLPIVFEFDTNNNVVPGHTPVPIPNNPTLQQVANAIAQAVTGVGLGLIPSNAGNGRVLLTGETPLHFFDPLSSTLEQLGEPGVAAAVPIPYLPTPDFTAVDMAQLITDLINSNETLVGITATRRGDEVILEGVSSATGILDSFVTGIMDLAGNPLQPNRDDNTTQFTIELGSGLDFGSAPQSLGYPSRLSANGARHEIVPGFQLGDRINVDVDGPQFPEDVDPAIDDNDGVVFGNIIRGYETTITVTARGITAARPGYLDAWIDFNADGDWADAGEQILSSYELVNGENVITINIPNNAALGETYARFRYSSTGGLAPTGFAPDGEVEDYQITIGSSPWQNAALPPDVNGDGRVNPFDVLLVVDFVRKYANQPLPATPPFIGIGGEEIFPANNMVDVDGNGRVTPFDALIIVSAIQAQNNNGEAEGEADDDLFAPLTSSSFEDLPTVTYSALAPTSLTHQTLASRPVTTSTFDASLTTPLTVPSQVREVTFRLEDRPARDSSSHNLERPVVAPSPFDDLLDELARNVNRAKSSEGVDAHEAIFSEYGE
jgi:hypothetical protein